MTWIIILLALLFLMPHWGVTAVTANGSQGH